MNQQQQSSSRFSLQDGGVARQHFGNAALSLAQLYRASVATEHEASMRMLERVRQFAMIAAGPDNAPHGNRSVNLQQLLRFLEVQENAVNTAAQRNVQPRTSRSGANSNNNGQSQQQQQLQQETRPQQPSAAGRLRLCNSVPRAEQPRFKRELWQTDVDTAVLAARDLEEALSELTQNLYDEGGRGARANATTAAGSSSSSCGSRFSPPAMDGGMTPQPLSQRASRQQHMHQPQYDNGGDFGAHFTFQEGDDDANNDGDDDRFALHQQQQFASVSNSQCQFSRADRWVRRRYDEGFS